MGWQISPSWPVETAMEMSHAFVLASPKSAGGRKLVTQINCSKRIMYGGGKRVHTKGINNCDNDAHQAIRHGNNVRQVPKGFRHLAEDEREDESDGEDDAPYDQPVDHALRGALIGVVVIEYCADQQVA
jgi:hypothetical protein